MLRTTVRLPDDLIDAAKERARRTGRTLTQLLEHAVRAELAPPASASSVAEGSPDYRYRSHQSEFPNSQSAQMSASHVDHVMAAVAELQAFLLAQPDRDLRSPDEILGYDANGLPA